MTVPAVNVKTSLVGIAEVPGALATLMLVTGVVLLPTLIPLAALVVSIVGVKGELLMALVVSTEAELELLATLLALALILLTALLLPAPALVLTRLPLPLPIPPTTKSMQGS